MSENKTLDRVEKTSTLDKDRKKTSIKKLVFSIDNEFYICDYIFYHTMHGKPFNGATFTVLYPVNKGQYEYQTSQEYLEETYGDIWRESVADGNTEDSLETWIHDNFLGPYSAGDEAIFDFSGYEYWDQIRELGFDEDEYPVIECIGGGRSHRLDPDKIYDRELWKQVCEAEGYIVGNS